MCRVSRNRVRSKAPSKQTGAGTRIRRTRRLKSSASLPADSPASAQAAGLRYVTAEGPGIVRRRLGRGFRYLGVDSKPLHDKATLKRIQSLVIPPGWEN